MRGIKKKIAVLLTAVMLFGNVGAQRVSFTDGSYEDEVRNSIDISDTVSGSAVKVSDDISNNSSENNYRISKIYRQKFSTNEEVIYLYFDVVMQNTDVLIRDNINIELRNVETKEVIGSIYKDSLFFTYDDIDACSLGVKILLSKKPCVNQNYEIIINSKDNQKFTCDELSETISFTDDIEFSKLIFDKGVYNYGDSNLFIDKNTRKINLKSSYVLNLGLEWEKNLIFMILDENNDNVGSGSITGGSYFCLGDKCFEVEDMYQGFHTNTAIEFKFNDDYNIQFEKKYKCIISDNNKNYMEFCVTPTERLFYDKLSVTNNTINDGTICFDVQNPINLEAVDFKLYNETNGEIILTVLNIIKKSPKWFEVTLGANDIPKGDYELFSISNGYDTKVDLPDNIKSDNNTSSIVNLTNEDFEVGSNNTFTKYSFPIYCKISREKLNYETVELIKNSLLKITVTNDEKVYYPIEKNIVIDNKFIYLVAEFGDKDFEEGNYNVNFSCSSSKSLIIECEKKLKICLDEPNVSICNIDRSSFLHVDMFKFSPFRSSDHEKENLVIKDDNSNELLSIALNYGTKKALKVSDQSLEDYGYKYNYDEINLNEHMPSYNVDMESCKYTLEMDKFKFDLIPIHRSIDIVDNDLIEGEYTFTLTLKLNSKSIKDNLKLELVSHINNKEKTIAISNGSVYKKYTDEITNSSSIVDFSFNTIGDVPFVAEDGAEYFYKIKDIRNNKVELVPANLYDIRCTAIFQDLNENLIEVTIDPRTISKIDKNKQIDMDIITHEENELGLNKNVRYTRKNGELIGNKLYFKKGFDEHFGTGTYEYEIIQDEKVLCRSSFKYKYSRLYIMGVLEGIKKDTSNDQAVFFDIGINGNDMNFEEEDIKNIEVISSFEKIGECTIDENFKIQDDSFGRAINEGYNKIISGKMILNKQIGRFFSLRLNLKDGGHRVINNIDLSKYSQKTLARIDYVENAIVDDKLDRFNGPRFNKSDLSSDIKLKFSKLRNVEDDSKLKVEVIKYASNNKTDNNTIDSKIDDIIFKYSQETNANKELYMTMKLPEKPKYGEKYYVSLYYDDKKVSSFVILFTESFYFKDINVMSNTNLSSSQDMLCFVINDAINIKKISDKASIKLRSIFDENKKITINGIRYIGAGDSNSKDYLIFASTKDIPVGEYSAYFDFSEDYRRLGSYITFTDAPRINSTVDYTYVGNYLKEITVYGANLDNYSNYKVYVYKFESDKNINSVTETEEIYSPELSKIINKVSVNENSDISILKDDIKDLKNGEYIAFFEKDSKLVGSCNIKIDEVSLNSILDFEINGGNSITSVRNTSILAKLNGCDSLRYSDNLDNLKSVAYSQVTKDEYSKGVAIRNIALQGDSGVKTIYLQLKDSRGNESDIIRHSIRLELPKENPINNGNSSSNTGSSGGSYGGGGGGFAGGGFVQPTIPSTNGVVTENNSYAEKKLADITNLIKNVNSKDGFKQIEKKLDEVSDLISKEKNDKNLQKISTQVNKEISALSKNSNTKKDPNLQKVIEMMGDTALKAIDSIEDNDKKFEEYKSLANTFLVADKNLKSTDELSRFKSELIRKASMTAGHAKTTVQYGDIIPKYVVDEKKISEVYNSNNKNYKDLETLSNKLLNGSSYINVKKEILVDLIDNKDLKISKVELKKDAIKDIKDKKIDVINIKSENTLLSIDPNTINEKNDYNLVISNRKKSVVKEEEGSKIDYKSLNDKNYLDINLFVGSTKVNNFEKPISLTFNVNEYVNVSALEKKAPMVYCYNDTSKVWEPIGGKYDKTSGTITVVRKDLAKYTVLPVPENTNEKVNASQTSVTREKFITLIGKNYGFSSLDSDIMFEDIDRSSESAKFILAAYEIGIVNGKGEKSFEPDGTLTYEEAAVIVARTLSKLDNKKIDKTLTEKLDKIDNNNKISSWAKDEFALVYELGLLDENAVKNPKANISEKELNELIEKL